MTMESACYILAIKWIYFTVTVFVYISLWTYFLQSRLINELILSLYFEMEMLFITACANFISILW